MFYTPSIRNAARKPTGAKLALKPFHVWDPSGLKVGSGPVTSRFSTWHSTKLARCDLLGRVSDLLTSGGASVACIVPIKNGRPFSWR